MRLAAEDMKRWLNVSDPGDITGVAFVLLHLSFSLNNEDTIA